MREYRMLLRQTNLLTPAYTQRQDNWAFRHRAKYDTQLDPDSQFQMLRDPKDRAYDPRLVMLKAAPNPHAASNARPASSAVPTANTAAPTVRTPPPPPGDIPVLEPGAPVR